jgi:hypothetical protein
MRSLDLPCKRIVYIYGNFRWMDCSFVFCCTSAGFQKRWSKLTDVALIGRTGTSAVRAEKHGEYPW